MKRLLILTLFVISGCTFEDITSTIGGLVGSDESELTFSDRGNLDVSRAAFRNTIYPVVSSCARCHDSTDPTAPNFHIQNSDAMHDYFTGVGLVVASLDPTVTSNARVLRRVRDERHNCGSESECDALATNLEAAIRAWAEQAASGVSNSGKFKTASVNINEALTTRVPEMYRKTLLFDAEDFIGAGGENRWKVREHPKAINKYYITTEGTPGHPVDRRNRTVTIDERYRCLTKNSYEAAYTNAADQAPVRYSEAKRYPDQNTGSEPYVQRLQIVFINPLKIQEFKDFMSQPGNQNASRTDITQFTLKDDGVDVSDFVNALNSDLSDSRNALESLVLTGTEFTRDIMPMLPPTRDAQGQAQDLVTRIEYQGNEAVDNITFSDLASFGTGYFRQDWLGGLQQPFSVVLTHNDLKNLIEGDANASIIKETIYRQIYDFYFSRVYNFGSNGNNEVSLFRLKQPAVAPAGSYAEADIDVHDGNANNTTIDEEYLKYWLYYNDPNHSPNYLSSDNFDSRIFDYVYLSVENVIRFGGDHPVNHFQDNTARVDGNYPVTRSFSARTGSNGSIRLGFGQEILDLNNILMAPEAVQNNVDLAQLKSNFATHVFPVIREGSAALNGTRCMNCHSDASSNDQRPAWGSTNLDVSYSTFQRWTPSVVDGTFTPFNVDLIGSDPRLGLADGTFRLPTRPIREQNHNCDGPGGSDACNDFGKAIAQAINDWHTANAPLFQVAPPEPKTISLPALEREPGRVSVTFKVNEEGHYSPWVKLLAKDTGEDGNDPSHDFNLRLLDSSGNPVAYCDYEEENCSYTTNPEPGELGCFEVSSNTTGMGQDYWYWKHFDQSGNEDVNNDNSDNELDDALVLDRTTLRGWKLRPGQYTLEIIEKELGAAIDMIAISANPGFDPVARLVDENHISRTQPQSIEWDISEFTEQQSRLRIDLEVGEEAYTVRNPTIFSEEGRSIRANVMRLLLNESFDFSNSTYLTIDEVTEFDRDNGADILTNTSIVALKLAGEENDRIAVSFEILNSTDEPSSDNRWNPPPDGIEVQCQHTELFTEIVFPILTNTNVMLIEENGNDATYNAYVQRFPGTSGDTDNLANPSSYFCIDCHDANHRFFPMVTFLQDQNGINQLCGQVLSRARGSIEPFDDLLIFKGINGYLGHPVIDVAHNRTAWNATEDREYIFNSTDQPEDFRWIDDEFTPSTANATTAYETYQDEKYNTASAFVKYSKEEVEDWITAAGANWSQREQNYCRQWIGHPRRVRHDRYNIRFDHNNDGIDEEILEENGEIMAVGDGFRHDISTPSPFISFMNSNPSDLYTYILGNDVDFLRSGNRDSIRPRQYRHNDDDGDNDLTDGPVALPCEDGNGIPLVPVDYSCYDPIPRLDDGGDNYNDWVRTNGTFMVLRRTNGNQNYNFYNGNSSEIRNPANISDANEGTNYLTCADVIDRKANNQVNRNNRCVNYAMDLACDNNNTNCSKANFSREDNPEGQNCFAPRFFTSSGGFMEVRRSCFDRATGNTECNDQATRDSVRRSNRELTVEARYRNAFKEWFRKELDFLGEL